MPYNITIQKLKEMQWIQNPIQKLNHIYTCLKFDLASEIDEFYNNVNDKLVSHFSKAFTLHEQLFPDSELISSINLKEVTKMKTKDRIIDIDNL